VILTHRSVVDVSVDSSVARVETSESLEEGSSSRSGTTDDEHHLPRLDNGGEVVKEIPTESNELDVPVSSPAKRPPDKENRARRTTHLSPFFSPSPFLLFSSLAFFSFSLTSLSPCSFSLAALSFFILFLSWIAPYGP
jgi:hypothetical protein